MMFPMIIEMIFHPVSSMSVNDEFIKISKNTMEEF